MQIKPQRYFFNSVVEAVDALKVITDNYCGKWVNFKIELRGAGWVVLAFDSNAQGGFIQP